METVSRCKNLIGATVYVDESRTELKQGEEYVKLKNMFGYTEIGFIIHWKDGKVHCDDDPAIVFDDAHVEYWQNGAPHNNRKNANGQRMPAILSDYMAIEEYWDNGKQIPNPNR